MLKCARYLLSVFVNWTTDISFCVFASSNSNCLLDTQIDVVSYLVQSLMWVLTRNFLQISHLELLLLHPIKPLNKYQGSLLKHYKCYSSHSTCQDDLHLTRYLISNRCWVMWDYYSFTHSLLIRGIIIESLMKMSHFIMFSQGIQV